MHKLETARELQHRLQTVLTTVEREFSLLNDNQLNWKQAPGRWSITECLQHLNLAERYYIRNIQKKADDLGLIQTAPVDQEFTSDWVGRAMLYIVDPKTKMKFPAPPMMRPRKDLEPRPVMTQFVELQQLLRELLDRAIYYDWNTTKLPTLFGNWLKVRLGDALLMLVAHTERHMAQAMRVKADPAFPGFN
ncbi:DinB family protein [Tellurirhabdus bombi]|uniref:DinB family protein n=1 Tax=Tellurirhabdus bombi TaxID=2907205 RepID=UPI001F1757CF|nr:DinB family protein [Tellurirhabdus bombi]